MSKKGAGKKKKNAHLWARDPDDFYVEPDFANVALFEKVKFDGGLIIDPCCGLGRILDAAKAAGYDTFGFDIKDRGASRRHAFMIRDFRDQTSVYPVPFVNVACNPPYKYDDEFVRWVVEATQRRAAILLNAQWANGDRRSRWLETLGLRYVLPITPRPSMPPGNVILAGEKPGNGTKDFSWYVFERGFTGEPTFGWARRPPRPASEPRPRRSKNVSKEEGQAEGAAKA